jgi:tetratricopeptide (TPR) repeat protein
MRLGKHTFTKTASIQVGVAIALAAFGLVLGLLAWSDYALYSNFAAGLRAQAAGRLELAMDPLAVASRRRGEYPYPAELEAKLKVDSGSPGAIDKALELYAWLEANGHRERPTVRLGKAAALIRKADLQAEGDRGKLLAEAGKSMAGVSWPEARILRAHIALRQGGFDAAKKDLEAVYNEARKGDVEIGLDSMADLYVGLGICAARGQQDLEASRMFRRANHLVPRTRTPLLNSVYLLSRQYATKPPPRDELVKTYEAIIRKVRESWMRDFRSDPQTYKGLDQASLTFVLSLAWACVVREEGDPHAFSILDHANGFSDTSQDTGRRELTMAAVCFSLMKKLPPGQSSKRNEYRMRAERSLEAANRLFSTSPKLQAQVQFMIAMLGAEMVLQEEGRDVGRTRLVGEAFDRSVTLDPANPAVHRNRGAYYLRTGQKEKAVAALEKYLELDKTPSPGLDQAREALARLKSGEGEKKP